MEIEYSLARKIRELANLITKNRDADIREFGLTTAQADTLLYFAENPGKSIVDLKSFFNITHQTAQGLVQRMAEKGLLIVSHSVNDARSKQIFLSEKAQSIYRDMLKNGTRTGNKLLEGMDAKERIQFQTLIDLGLENLKEIQGKKGE